MAEGNGQGPIGRGLGIRLTSADIVPGMTKPAVTALPPSGRVALAALALVLGAKDEEVNDMIDVLVVRFDDPQTSLDVVTQARAALQLLRDTSGQHTIDADVESPEIPLEPDQVEPDPDAPAPVGIITAPLGEAAAPYDPEHGQS